MARLPKTADTAQGHRTKKELELRKQGEAKLRSNRTQHMSEAVQSDPVATKYYLRLVELYDDIDMNEGFFENCINRYCLLLSDHDRLTKLLNEAYELETSKETLQLISSIERQISKIRDQLLSIEKENLLTVNSKLRAVPKKPEQVEVSPLEQFKRKYS